jgi:uncharacterized membrane protein
MVNNISKIKLFLVFIGCLVFRLIPLRAPNVEPIMASVMPLGRKYGALMAFAFGFLSIFLYDLLTNFGSWTWIAAFTYGIVGMASSVYFKKLKDSTFNFITFAFIATIFFDLITGVLFAPMWGQTILNALILQIPFTALHLAGNIGFALTISPLINKWLLSPQLFSYNQTPSLLEVKI